MEGEALLQARLNDAVAKVARGECGVLPFLTPGQRKQAERVLTRLGYARQAYFFGGYAEAERVCLFLLPEYMPDCLSAPIAQCAHEELAGVLGETLTDAVSAVYVQGSTYRTLTHRDYLGSVLGLGLERDALGDVAVQDDCSAVIFCSNTVARFLVQSLEKVASDTVRTSHYTVDERFTTGRTYKRITDTVASARLDCAVASLARLSRDGAQELIRKGFVEVDYECIEQVGATLEPPVVLTVRGHGKFRLLAFDGETKKGRLRLVADQYV